MIQELLLDKAKLAYKENNIDYLLNTTVTGKPTSYTIFEDNIILYPMSTQAYNITVITRTDKYVKQVHTVDVVSLSGQNKLYLTSTEGLFAGDLITVFDSNLISTTYTVLTAVENDYVTLSTNLSSTYATGNTAEKYKIDFEYENDEPRLPARFHKIIEYHALSQLYFSNAPKLARYDELYNTFTREIGISDRGSVNRKPRFTFRY